MPLQWIAGVEALCPVARPQRFHRLARLIHGESRLGTEPQLGLEVRHLVALGGGLERDGRLAQEVARRVDQAARASDLDLHGLEIRHPCAGVSARALAIALRNSS